MEKSPNSKRNVENVDFQFLTEVDIFPYLISESSRASQGNAESPLSVLGSRIVEMISVPEIFHLNSAPNFLKEDKITIFPN